MLQGNSWKIGRLGGVEIRIDPSWAIIALLVGYSFFVLLSNQFETLAGTGRVLLAVVMAALFFGSVLIHELTHSWVALARGIEVKGITLFLFGGATHADLETNEPTDELIVSAVGPISSLAIAALFWMASVAFGTGALAFATGYLGWVNLLLAVFNLLPGFPLDGGRVLRSLIWRSSGDLLKATRIASGAGRVLGGIIVVIGVLEVVLLGQLVGGLWFVAIGWFLSQAALASLVHLQIKTTMREVPASRLMIRDIIEIPAGIDVDEAVDRYFLQHNHSAFPVTSAGETIGLVSMSSIRELPREKWKGTPIEDVSSPLSEVCTVRATDSVGDVVPKLMQGEVGRVVVVEDGQVLGLITPRDVVRWLERAQTLGDNEGQLTFR
ncbi:MAG: site-2 protease family protein [Acidimicrobiia bacterium]